MIQGILTTLLTGLIIWLLSRSSSKPVEPSGHKVFVLRVIKGYLYLGIISLVMGVTLLVGGVSVFIEESNSVFLMIMTLVGLAFIYGGAYLYLLFKNYEVIYDDKGLEVTNFKKKATSVEWTEITSAKFSPLSSSLKIKSSQKPVHIHQHIKGVKQFMTKLIGETGITLKETKMPIRLD